MATNNLRKATAEIVGYGTAGTILDSAYEILEELDPELAAKLEEITDVILERFKLAENLVWVLTADPEDE